MCRCSVCACVSHIRTPMHACSYLTLIHILSPAHAHFRLRTSIINPCTTRREVVRVELMHRGLKVQQYHHQERSIVH